MQHEMDHLHGVLYTDRMDPRSLAATTPPDSFAPFVPPFR